MLSELAPLQLGAGWLRGELCGLALCALASARRAPADPAAAAPLVEAAAVAAMLLAAPGTDRGYAEMGSVVTLLETAPTARVAQYAAAALWLLLRNNNNRDMVRWCKLDPNLKALGFKGST